MKLQDMDGKELDDMKPAQIGPLINQRLYQIHKELVSEALKGKEMWHKDEALEVFTTALEGAKCKVRSEMIQLLKRIVDEAFPEVV